MAGRRERQKQSRQRAILRSATRLFSRRGYEATSIEAIAAGAKLAAGTVYNYFPSKAEILLAIVRRDVTEISTQLEAMVKDLPPDPVAGIAALFDACVDTFLAHDRPLWRELMGAAMASPDTLGRGLFEADLQLIAHLAAAIRELQARRLLGNRFDAGRAALTLYGSYLSWILAWMMTDAIDEHVLRRELHASVELWVHGLGTPSEEAAREETV